jgi:phosphohistidine phosphatase
MATRSIRVTLLRHGLAVDREDWAKKNDLARPLTPKGERRVRQASRGLAALGVKPDLVLTSPAIRAVQTAKAAAEVLGVPPAQVHEEVSLAPDASPEDFLATIEALEVKEVLAVGHAPHLDEVLAGLLGLRHGRGGLALKKSGAALLRVARGRPGAAEVRALLSPWSMRRIGKKAR